MIAATASVSKERMEMFVHNCFQMPTDPFIYYNHPNVGVVKAYQAIYESNREDDVVVYLHDDVEIHEPTWWQEVMAEMTDDTAIVGLGGALGLGVPDVYKTPYRIEQLARQEYYSNQTDWQVHGKQETGVKRVAVVDGFVMALNTEFLKEIGGWSWIQSDFHCYDLAMCLMAARRGWQVKMIGISATHHGGGTSTKAEYIDWLKEKGRTAEEDHARPHRWLYDEFMDVIPLRVE